MNVIQAWVFPFSLHADSGVGRDLYDVRRHLSASEEDEKYSDSITLQESTG
jgi:hypothetical protein